MNKESPIRMIIMIALKKKKVSKEKAVG